MPRKSTKQDDSTSGPVLRPRKDPPPPASPAFDPTQYESLGDALQNFGRLNTSRGATQREIRDKAIFTAMFDARLAQMYGPDWATHVLDNNIEVDEEAITAEILAEILRTRNGGADFDGGAGGPAPAAFAGGPAPAAFAGGPAFPSDPPKETPEGERKAKKPKRDVKTIPDDKEGSPAPPDDDVAVASAVALTATTPLLTLVETVPSGVESRCSTPPTPPPLCDNLHVLRDVAVQQSNQHDLAQAVVNQLEQETLVWQEIESETLPFPAAAAPAEVSTEDTLPFSAAAAPAGVATEDTLTFSAAAAPAEVSTEDTLPFVPAVQPEAPEPPGGATGAADDEDDTGVKITADTGGLPADLPVPPTEFFLMSPVGASGSQHEICVPAQNYRSVKWGDYGVALGPISRNPFEVCVPYMCYVRCTIPPARKPTMNSWSAVKDTHPEKLGEIVLKSVMESTVNKNKYLMRGVFDNVFDPTKETFLCDVATRLKSINVEEFGWPEFVELIHQSWIKAPSNIGPKNSAIGLSLFEKITPERIAKDTGATNYTFPPVLVHHSNQHVQSQVPGKTAMAIGLMCWEEPDGTRWYRRLARVDADDVTNDMRQSEAFRLCVEHAERALSNAANSAVLDKWIRDTEDRACTRNREAINKLRHANYNFPQV